MRSQEPRSSSSCAACKFLKRRCIPNCIFAPYFRSDEPKKFAKVHKVFGASNVSKILIEVPEEQREDTVNSLAYEAEARLKDPVYGCIGAIALLQRKMVELQLDLAIAKARLAKYTYFSPSSSSRSSTMTTTTTTGPGMVLDRSNFASSFAEFSGYCGGYNENFSQNSSELCQDGFINVDFNQFPYIV